MDEAQPMDSPFRVYLGHNAITESAAQEGLETSQENIERKFGRPSSNQSYISNVHVHSPIADAPSDII